MSIWVEVSNSGQLCASKIGTTEPAVRFSLRLASDPKVLHKDEMDDSLFTLSRSNLTENRKLHSTTPSEEHKIELSHQMYPLTFYEMDGTVDRRRSPSRCGFENGASTCRDRRFISALIVGYYYGFALSPQ
ncbi:hypothetical protein BHE74_00042236 [Ensete ventricosum]|nr:hypothetical protein BHE74_00042236 [Ensete ventricosum]